MKRQDVQKGLYFHPPTPARQGAHVTEQGRREAHGAANKRRHGCARRRDGEPVVSARTTLEDLFNILLEKTR